MPPSGYDIPLTEEMAERLDALPLFRQRIVLEHAIGKALDSEGWPRGERGVIPIPTSYWYVVLSRDGMLRGYVGPITSESAARRAAASWKQTGASARIARTPVGPSLTNAYD